MRLIKRARVRKRRPDRLRQQGHRLPLLHGAALLDVSFMQTLFGYTCPANMFCRRVHANRCQPVAAAGRGHHRRRLPAAANPVLVLLLPLAVPGLLFAEAGVGKAAAQLTTAWRCQSCRHGCHWHVQRVLRHLNDADGGEL
jgi:hypothetical protein